MKNLSFWVQSLDNQSPDIIISNREKLYDEKLRQQLVSEIYEVPAKNRENLLSEPSVTVRYNNSEFVIEAIPIEKDQANRLAPIVIYGKWPEKLSSDWIEAVCTEIENVVSEQIQRTLNRSTLEAIRNWLTNTLEVKKKKILPKEMISLIIGLLTPLLVFLLIHSQNLKLTAIQVGCLIALNNLLIISVQTLTTSQSQIKIKLK